MPTAINNLVIRPIDSLGNGANSSDNYIDENYIKVHCNSIRDKKVRIKGAE
ncbi:MAG: hypothetical protein ACI936_002243 [Paraglaciecola sp.]|jgi:hypothetical protein